MKFGVRTPSIKKSFKARTTGRVKRQIKKSVIPMYGKKGTGIYKNPKKAIYNKVYNKTSFSAVPSLFDLPSPKGEFDTSTIKNISDFPKIPKRYVRVLSDKEIRVAVILIFVFFISFFIPVIAILFIGAIIAFIARIITRTQITVLDKKTGEKSTISKIQFSNFEKEYREQKVKYSKIHLSSQLNLYNSYLQQALESSQIIETTANPETYFSRYKLLLDRLDKLISIAEDPRLLSAKGDFTQVKQKLISNKDEISNKFIERAKLKTKIGMATLKTDRGKENRLNKLKDELLSYSAYLNQHQLEYITNWTINNI